MTTPRKPKRSHHKGGNIYPDDDSEEPGWFQHNVQERVAMHMAALSAIPDVPPNARYPYYWEESDNGIQESQS